MKPYKLNIGILEYMTDDGEESVDVIILPPNEKDFDTVFAINEEGREPPFRRYVITVNMPSEEAATAQLLNRPLQEYEQEYLDNLMAQMEEVSRDLGKQVDEARGNLAKQIDDVRKTLRMYMGLREGKDPLENKSESPERVVTPSDPKS